MDAILQLESIGKNFGELEILRNVTLSLGRGESLAILGPSGAGKSTLLHIAGLMERPTRGQVRLLGRPADQMSEDQRAAERLNTIGFMFQFHHLLPDFNVLENVLIPTRLAGDDLTQAEVDARSLLDRLGLSARLLHKPYQLSGGEQQRAALARALIRKPRLLLCDEPTGNLDQHTAEEVLRMIWSEVSRNGLATILVTHNEHAASKAEKSYHLVEGQLEERQKVST